MAPRPRDHYVDLVEREYFSRVVDPDMDGLLALFADDATITVLHVWLNIGFATLMPRADAKEKFRVGFLPVTCHLTCPVTDWINTNMVGEGFFLPRKFNGWPEIKEALLSGDLPCTFMLAPLAMKLVEDGAPAELARHASRYREMLLAGLDPMVRRALGAVAGPGFAVAVGLGLVGVGDMESEPSLVISGLPLAAHALSLTMIGGDGRAACGV